MINWRLFWQIISQHIVFIVLSYLLIVLATTVSIFNEDIVSNSHDSKTLDAGVIFGFGYFLIFNFLGQRLRSLMAYDLNHMLPNYRVQIVKITSAYILFLLAPLFVCYYFYDLSYTRLLVITFISLFVITTNLFNQTVTVVITCVAFLVGGYEFGKAKAVSDYNAFGFLPFSTDILLLILTILSTFLLIGILLKLPKQYFGISGGKSTAEARTIDPLLNKGKFTKTFRQKKLQLYYLIMDKIDLTKSNIGICFWNYNFSSLNNLRYTITFLAILFYIIETEFLKGFMDGWNSVHIDKGGETHSDNTILISVFSYFFLAIFSIFDGSKLAAFTTSVNFLWLKQSNNGIRHFINSIYYVMAKITLKEACFSYLCYILVLASFSLESINLTYLTLIFLIIKIANIALMQALTSNMQRRWVWLIIGIVNAFIFIGLAIINSQQTLDTNLILSLILFLIFIASYTLLKYNYEQKINNRSLAY